MPRCCLRRQFVWRSATSSRRIAGKFAPARKWNSSPRCREVDLQLRTFLTDQEIRPHELLAEFLNGSDEVGALVSFCGLARARGSSDGAPLRLLRLERHPRLTERSPETIARDAAGRFELASLLVVHRWGKISPREVIVFVATAARHRRAAFLGADYLMDRLKTEAVLWKKEEGIDGGRWIEPSDADRAALARWDD